MPPEDKTTVSILSARVVFVLALAVRLSLFLVSGPWKGDWPQRLTYVGDPFEYAVLGRSLLTRAEFSLTWPVPIPNALRLPVYPIFIALTSGGGHLEMLWLTILCQLVVDSLFAVFLMRCLSLLFRRNSIGGIGGLLYACNPDAALWSTQLLAESISLWLIIGALYGLAVVMELAQKRNRGRFVLGVLCGALLPLCKPIWQYLWLLLLGWMVLAVLRTRSRVALFWLIAGTLVIAAPGLTWMKRNYDAWGIFTLSVSKPYVQREIAKGILLWAGLSADQTVPDYTREMQMHFLLPDFNRPNAMPQPFMDVTAWDRGALIRDYREGEKFFSLVRRRYWSVYLKQHVVGTAYLLLSPGTNYVRRFIGANALSEENFGFIGGADLSTKAKFVNFLRRSLAQPTAIAWTTVVLAFLTFYYLAVLAGVLTYWKKYRWRIWSLFLIGGGLFVFLLGPVGSSRYRFVLIQAFLPLACIGVGQCWQAWLQKQQTDEKRLEAD